MISFIVCAAVLVCAVVVWVLRPLLTGKHGKVVQRDGVNAAVYRDQLAELGRDLTLNRIDQSAYDQSVAEIQQRLTGDLESVTQSPVLGGVPASRAPKFTMLAVALAVPALAIGLYLVLGSPSDLSDSVAHRQAMQSDVEKMVAGLAAKLEQNPSDLKGWTMLGRSYKVLHRPADAAAAYERAGAYLETDAQDLAEYADVLASMSNGDFSGRPAKLIEQALKVEPDNVMALWLSGTIAFNGQDYARAVQQWEHLAQQLQPDSDDWKSIQASIGEARERGGLAPVAEAGKASAASKAGMQQAAVGDPAASISGTVDIAPALKEKYAAAKMLYIIARAPGVKIPVAVIRTPVGALPYHFVLDDRAAMQPDVRLSAQKQVTLEARVSISGDAMPQPGDLLSVGSAVTTGSQNVAVLINQIHP